MNYRVSKYRNNFRPLRYIAWMLFFVLLVAPAKVDAQAIRSEAPTEDFYRERAAADAELEHQLRWKYEEDEKDFWMDQRNFENDLKAEDPLNYHVYMTGKRLAYDYQETQCTAACNHGKIYKAQSDLYLQYSEGSENLADAVNGEGKTPVVASGHERR
ncbi:hypothetical protein [Zeaxanthinibacter enoshimensis]|uniref:Uncharacterized protein n=1 Tax=Zeaxanthinibacter enoshimensis TaxID=392009 RepID=A0A4R6TQ22_9FLAO|nr:hypothetical protein [Zeaxanthinibacter enoshimensis]TDQ32536.1 hypothetical protein CLV82_0365 [Zeaxanthinibacter enoshimensis]